MALLKIRPIDPLSHNVRIVDEQGHPTPQFIRQWAMSRQVNLTTDDLNISVDALQTLIEQAQALIATLETEVAAVQAFAEAVEAATITALAGKAALSHDHDATDVTTGDFDDARLSSNVPLKNTGNVFTALQTMASGAGLGVAIGSGSVTFASGALQINTNLLQLVSPSGQHFTISLLPPSGFEIRISPGNRSLRFTMAGTGSIHFDSGAVGSIPVIVKRFASQTANVTEWRDESNAVLTAILAGGGLEFTEQTDPAAPATNKLRVFARDNGAGKTELCVRCPTGAIGVLYTEP